MGEEYSYPRVGEKDLYLKTEARSARPEEEAKHKRSMGPAKCVNWPVQLRSSLSALAR